MLGLINLSLVVAAYLLGAVPFGWLIARARGVDILSRGSGNIGATNVARVLGARLGVVCFVLDALKGFLPVFVARMVHGAVPGTPLPVVLVGLAAIAGHNWSVYLRFRGGKGVATSCGVFAALFPLGLLVALAVWVAVVAATRYVSLASILAGVSLFVAAMILPRAPFGVEQIPLTVFAGLAAVLGIIRHRANIARLIRGTEPRIGQPPQSRWP